jgi:hypothetical protein
MNGSVHHKGTKDTKYEPMESPEASLLFFVIFVSLW